MVSYGYKISPKSDIRLTTIFLTMATIIDPTKQEFISLYKDFLHREGALFQSNQRRLLSDYLKSVEGEVQSDLVAHAKALRTAMIAHR